PPTGDPAFARRAVQRELEQLGDAVAAPRLGSRHADRERGVVRRRRRRGRWWPLRTTEETRAEREGCSDRKAALHARILLAKHVPTTAKRARFHRNLRRQTACTHDIVQTCACCLSRRFSPSAAAPS